MTVTVNQHCGRFEEITSLTILAYSDLHFVARSVKPKCALCVPMVKVYNKCVVVIVISNHCSR